MKNMVLLSRSGISASRWRGWSPRPETSTAIWVYEDAADRSRRRAAMMADPEWQAYLEKNAEAGYLLKQESKLMSPAAFAPLRR